MEKLTSKTSLTGLFHKLLDTSLLYQVKQSFKRFSRTKNIYQFSYSWKNLISQLKTFRPWELSVKAMRTKSSVLMLTRLTKYLEESPVSWHPKITSTLRWLFLTMESRMAILSTMLLKSPVNLLLLRIIFGSVFGWCEWRKNLKIPRWRKG